MKKCLGTYDPDKFNNEPNRKKPNKAKSSKKTTKTNVPATTTLTTKGTSNPEQEKIEGDELKAKVENLRKDLSSSFLHVKISSIFCVDFKGSNKHFGEPLGWGRYIYPPRPFCFL